MLFKLNLNIRKNKYWNRLADETAFESQIEVGQ